MKKFLLRGIALVALAAGGSANAADMPIGKAPLPVWNWTGGYISVHVGAQAGRTDFSDPYGHRSSATTSELPVSWPADRSDTTGKYVRDRGPRIQRVAGTRLQDRAVRRLSPSGPARQLIWLRTGRNAAQFGTGCFDPTVPTSVLVGQQQSTWQAIRVGLAGETMLGDRWRLSGEVAYLPWVKMKGRDNHLLRPETTYFEQWGAFDQIHVEQTAFEVLPARFDVSRLGVFVQSSFKFDWTDGVKARN
jgi:hypothetical protein